MSLTRRRTRKAKINDLIVNKLTTNSGQQLSTDELALLDGLTANATELNKLDGATVTTAEINALDGAPMAAAFVVGAQAGDVINVAVQLRDANAADLAVRGAVIAYLSDDANGDSVAGTAPDTVAIGTDGVAIPLVAGKAFQLISEADGDIDLDITEDGADTWYLVIVLANGKLVASGAITFA